MAVHGVLDCLFSTAATSNYANQYVTLFNFLTGTQAQSVGIQRIAYSTGSSPTGTGTDYVGTANAIGKNAWSLWCWTSASIPWYLLLQETFGGVTFGSSPGNPGLANAAGASTDCIAASFAFLGNGATGSNGPWNGTTNNNGRDTKGTSVWKTGSTGNIPNDTLHVFPRSNSGGGTHQALKQNMTPLGIINITTNQRMHFLCDEETFCSIIDSQSADSLYGVTYFGKYNVRSGSTAKPYVHISHPDSSFNTFNAASYGTAAGGSYSTAEGGIAVPAYPNGTLAASAMSGTCIVYVSVLDEMYTAVLQPNLVLNPSAYDEGVHYLAWNETPYYAGFAGTLDWVRTIFGVSNNDTNTDKTRAFFGSGLATTLRKLSVPWNGVTVPGVGLSVTGTIF